MAFVSAHSTQLGFELLQLHSGVQRVAKPCHSGGWQTIEHRYHVFPLSVIVTLVLPRLRQARETGVYKETYNLCSHPYSSTTPLLRYLRTP